MRKIFLNKRRKNFSKIKKFNIFIFLFVLILFIYSLSSVNKVKNLLNNYIEEYSNQYGYNLQQIDVVGLKFINTSEIVDYFNPFRDKSIFLVPIKDISKQIILNKWVKNIQIKNDYKNILYVTIQEEVPFGIYDNNYQKILFSSDLVVLEIIQDASKYSDLIIFYGQNSIANSKFFLSYFDKDFLDMIRSAHYIKNRRWDIYLNNNIMLRFPELEINRALKNYKKIYANFSNKELKEIESIDLRINGQAIIKFKNKND